MRILKVLVIMIVVIGLMLLVTEKDHPISEKLPIYNNEYFGYMLNIPENMEIDESLLPVRTRIFNGTTDIDIFYDDLSKGNVSFETYTNYSNRFLSDTKYHKNIKISEENIHGNKVRIINFERDKLSKVENDKNYYCSIEINVKGNKAYTIFVKSSSHISEDIMNTMKTFKTTDKFKTAEVEDNKFKQIEPKVSETALSMYNKYFIDSKELIWGIFEPSAPDNMSKLNEIEEKISYDFKFLLRYQSLSKGLPADAIKNAYKDGKIVELTLQTIDTVPGELDIYEILSGKYDEYFNQYAKDIKALNFPVLFRLDNEMNGDWCKYSAFFYAKDTDLYKETWKHIYNIFKENNTDNVIWVWNPNSKSFPDFKWNDALLYYPGDEYVDVVGLTAYNTGNYYEGETWKTFDELYKEHYSEYSRIFEKPLMITEFGSSTFGGDKKVWVEDMFTKIKNYDRIKAAIWWSHTDYDNKGNEARVYRIDAPSEILEVFKNNLN